MLILKLHRAQSAQIGLDVSVKVLKIAEDWVKLAISAPTGTRIVWRYSEHPEQSVAATEPQTR